MRPSYNRMSFSMDRRWLAFIVLCLGDLMIVLDSTVVNVALPTIRGALGFSEASLAWVVNSYLLTFGGFLLLGGRLADLYGQRRLFLIGLSVFTAASLVCGMAGSAAVLIVARAIQGLGGAVVSAVALSLITNLFPEPAERVRAMGYFGFVMAAGGSVGVLLGGLLTNAFDWHWIFLINLPVGAAVFAAALRLLAPDIVSGAGAKLDVGGAVTITAALLLAIYAIVNGNAVGWTSVQTLAMLMSSLALFAAFLVIEAKVAAPLMPLHLFRARNVSVSNTIGILWAAGMFAWFFLSALYMQSVLGYSPLHVGLAFLPANVIMGAFSYKLSAIVVNRFGIRAPLCAGLVIAALGLLSFALAPADGTFMFHVLPGMTLLGIGAGVAFNPILLAAMNDVKPEESGLASGVVNTSFMMGGALGLAVLASLAATRTLSLMAAGADANVALHGGYQIAFGLGAVLAFTGGMLALALHDSKPADTAPH